MCPVCMSTAAIIAYGTGATAGLTALVLGTRRAWRQALAPRSVPQSEDLAPLSAESIPQSKEK
jgi:hypothetical protein